MREENDANYHRQLQRPSLHQPNILRCQQGHKIVQVCCSDTCNRPAFFCEYEECSIKAFHRSCITLEIQSLNKCISDKKQLHEGFFTELMWIETQGLQKLENARQIIMKRFAYGNMEERQIAIIRQIIEDKNVGEILGSQINFLYQKLKNLKRPIEKKTVNLLHEFECFSDLCFQEISKVRNETVRNYIQKGFNEEGQFRIISRVLQRGKLQFEQLQNYNSLLANHEFFLNKQLLNEKIELLRSNLGNVKQIKLLFRASENGFSAAKFHDICNYISNTLTLVRTESGLTIAAYTSNMWVKDKCELIDDSGQSFVMNMNIKKKRGISRFQIATCNNYKKGPCFGSYLTIQDYCNENNESKGTDPVHFIGKIQQYEVFQIIK